MRHAVVPPDVGRGGFVLVFVVFMLFAVSVAAATGYLVVSLEFAMARQSSEGTEALAVARAALERFIAEEMGVVADTTVYALGDGVAVVTARKMFAQDSITDMYYVRSEAEVVDPRTPATPASRVVGAYAIHRRRPLPHHAAAVIGADFIRVESGGSIDAFDEDSPSDCSGGGASPITGAVALTAVQGTSDINGSPDGETWADWSAVLDSARVRWDVLSDPDFPVDFDGTWPTFSSLPSDSFPVIRHSGWLYTNVVGRGVLIVDGVFDSGPDFDWRGIVLARHVDDYIQGDLEGLLVGGLGQDNMYSTVYYLIGHDYASCDVYAANESLSYLELVDNTIFETY